MHTLHGLIQQNQNTNTLHTIEVYINKLLVSAFCLQHAHNIMLVYDCIITKHYVYLRRKSPHEQV